MTSPGHAIIHTSLRSTPTTGIPSTRRRQSSNWAVTTTAAKSRGWGVFRRFDRRLALTDPDGTGVSNWRLPRWFYPEGSKLPLTYHPDRKRWQRDADHAYLRTVGRGQEFVLDLPHYPEAAEWLASLVSNLGSNTQN